MSSNTPKLLVVGTPIGNLGDLSPRAREALAEADLILAEDTRVAGKLFQLADVQAGRMMSLFEHNEVKRCQQVLELLHSGRTAALISSAGTPLISDPGYRIVRACRDSGFQVVPIPGPNAPITALMASGLPPYPFAFLGFLPRKKGEKRQSLLPYAGLKTTLIFFERKSRLRETLEVAHSLFQDREACLARELTKQHEEFILFRLGDASIEHLELRGEFTVLIGPPEEWAAAGAAQVKDLIARELALGGKPKDIVARVQKQIHGWTQKDLYTLVVQLKDHSR